MDASRQCVKCWAEKSASEFAKDPRVKSGLNARCRACFNEGRKQRYAADPEAGRQRTRGWRAANPDKVIEVRQRQWQNNREEICRRSLESYYKTRESRLKTMATYREANRAAIYEAHRAWRATPAGRVAVSAGGRRRRAAKAALPTERYTLDDIVERDGTSCCLCSEEVVFGTMDIKALPTVEHHIPLQGDRTLIEELGIEHPGDVFANVGLAHYRCNSSKKSRYGLADVDRYLANVERRAA